MAFFGIKAFTTTRVTSFKFGTKPRTSNGVPILKAHEDEVTFTFEDGQEATLRVNSRELEVFLRAWLEQPAVRALLQEGDSD